MRLIKIMKIMLFWHSACIVIVWGAKSIKINYLRLLLFLEMSLYNNCNSVYDIFIPVVFIVRYRYQRQCAGFLLFLFSSIFYLISELVSPEIATKIVFAEFCASSIFWNAFNFLKAIESSYFMFTNYKSKIIHFNDEKSLYSNLK